MVVYSAVCYVFPPTSPEGGTVFITTLEINSHPGANMVVYCPMNMNVPTNHTRGEEKVGQCIWEGGGGESRITNTSVSSMRKCRIGNTYSSKYLRVLEVH